MDVLYVPACPAPAMCRFKEQDRHNQNKVKTSHAEGGYKANSVTLAASQEVNTAR